MEVDESPAAMEELLAGIAEFLQHHGFERTASELGFERKHNRKQLAASAARPSGR